MTEEGSSKAALTKPLESENFIALLWNIIVINLCSIWTNGYRFEIIKKVKYKRDLSQTKTLNGVF